MSSLRLLGASVVLAALPALAATIDVTTPADDVTVNGNCTLREAVRAANLDTAVDACPAGTGDDVINVPEGTYTLTLPGRSEQAALTGDLDLTGTLSIVGAGSGATILDGNDLDRLFELDSTAVVDITGVTVRNGNADTMSGGGILSGATALSLVDVVLTDNFTYASGGGLFASGGSVTLTGCTVSGNTSNPVVGGGGGGIALYDGTLVITDSTIADNSAVADLGGGLYLPLGTATVVRSTIARNFSEDGGGIANLDRLTVVNSTLSDNYTLSGPYGGGGLLNFGSGRAWLHNVTVAGNEVYSDSGAAGGGVSHSGSRLELRNTIIAGNRKRGTSTADDCYGTLSSRGHNLVQTVAGCTMAAATGDLVDVDPLLGDLADNGGPTATRALFGGSPAIDGGDPAGCTDDANAALTTDQRQAPRPLGAICDIGAFEADPAAPVTTSTSTSTTTTSSGVSTSTTTTSSGGSTITTTTSSGGSTSTTTTTLPPDALCTAGVTLVHPKVILRNPGGAPGSGSFVAKGILPFPAGTPATFVPATRGAQLVIADLGADGALVVDLSGDSALPPGAACGTGGWRGPVFRCPDGSLGGLRKLKLKDRRAAGAGILFLAKGKRANLPSVTGPLALTVVLGATAEAGDAGECGHAAFPPTLCRRRLGTVRCK